MPRQRTGYVYYDPKRKSHTARLDYTDATGKKRLIRRQVPTKTEGKLLLKKIIRELEDGGSRALDGDKMTFAQLTHKYTETRLQPATFQDGMKTSGLKSVVQAKLYVRVLAEHFGRKTIRTITHADVEKFKLKRLAEPTIHKKERSIASVNRELQLLRNVFNFAKRNGWIHRSPFEMGESLISKAQEKTRDRVLSRDEEHRLLAVCAGTIHRELLRSILICALDTGMRRGEMFKMQWSDVDLEARQLIVRPENSKTEKMRVIGISARLVTELKRLWEVAPKTNDALVFGVTTTVKDSFRRVCAEAGIENFRLHDCRHSATTRMVAAGMQPMEVMKITGHTQTSTFLRYLNLTADTARNAASAIDNWNAQATEIRSEFIN